jgi:hypothetical protein
VYKIIIFALRKVVEYSSGNFDVEVYFLKFNLCTHSNESHMISEQFSRGITLGKRFNMSLIGFVTVFVVFLF